MCSTNYTTDQASHSIMLFFSFIIIIIIINTITITITTIIINTITTGTVIKIMKHVNRHHLCHSGSFEELFPGEFLVPSHLFLVQFHGKPVHHHQISKKLT